MKPLASSRAAQRGMTLLEALVALVILTLGVLGLAAVQARMLVETRTTNSRAAAIRLIGELNERMQLNPAGAQPGANADYSPALSPYSDLAAGSFSGVVQASLALDCPNAAPACSAAQQAAYDVALWRQNVAGALPGGRASIWQISPRQLQVVVAWQARENTRATLSADAPPDAALQVAAPMRITADAAANVCGASAETICHIDFIDIPPAK